MLNYMQHPYGYSDYRSSYHKDFYSIKLNHYMFSLLAVTDNDADLSFYSKQSSILSSSSMLALIQSFSSLLFWVVWSAEALELYDFLSLFLILLQFSDISETFSPY